MADTEDAYINWHGCRVAVSYKYDLSVIVYDLMTMIEAVAESSDGRWEGLFGSNTLHVAWSLNWDVTSFAVKCDWVSVAGGVEDILNKKPTLRVSRMDFLSEWMEIIRVLNRELDVCQVLDQLSDGEMFCRVARLADGWRRGVLYR